MYAPYLTRLANYLRDFLLDLTSPAPDKVDAEFNQLLQGYNSLNLIVRGITDADGHLRNVAVATAEALVGAQRFSATALQTVFVTTIPWNVSFTNTNVLATSAGLLIDPNLVAVADDGNGYLQVTVPAQPLNTVVFLSAFESGAGILTRLQSLSTGEGASLIAVEDAAGNFTAVTQEGVNEEIADLITALDATLTTLNTNAILKTGTVTFTANQPMGGHKLTGLGAGTPGSSDSVRQSDITSAALQAILGTYLTSTFLPLAGGTMTGAINLGSNKITSLATGTATGNAVNWDQLQLYLPLAGGTMTGAIAMGTKAITGMANAVAAQDAVTLAQAQNLATSFSSLTDYAIAGANTFVVPAGVSKIFVEMWGGGGGGSSAGSSLTAYGAGGGAYGSGIIPVTPAETLTLSIGAAGTPDVNGGDSNILRSATSLLLAGGGKAGTDGAGSGIGGTGTVGVGTAGFVMVGGNGEACFVNSGATDPIAMVYGKGGNSPRGGEGGRSLKYYTGIGTIGTGGTTGVAPGGGGAYVIGAGASGGAGRIIIRY